MRERLALVVVWLLCALGALVGLLWLALAAVAGSHRAWTIAIGFDEAANAAFGGSATQTISARCWMYRNEYPYRILRPAIDFAFGLMGQRQHCMNAFIDETKAG